MSTVDDILVAAVARSRQNEPSDLATFGTELLAVVNRSLAALYAVAARLNPEYVGAIVTVTPSGGAWARPALAESVWRVETLAGATVAVLPPDDRAADPGVPAIYRLGRSYFPAGRANDPSGDLRFYCAMRPAALTATSDPLPASWDRAYNDCLILDVAIYLALKDGRQDELPRLQAEREAWEALYRQFLAHESVALRRRFGVPGAALTVTAGGPS